MYKINVINWLFLFLSAYLLASSFLGVADKKAIRMISQYSKKDKSSREVLRKKLACYIPVPASYVDKYDKYLSKVDKNMDAEEFFADQIIQVLIWSMFLMIACILKMRMMIFVIILLCITDIYNRQNKISDMAKEYERKVLFELPHFIQYITLSIDADQDLVYIIEKYRRICKEPLLDGMDSLLSDLNTGNYHKALINFDERFDMPSISAVVAGLIKFNKGDNQKTYFYMLEQDVKMKMNNIIAKELKKRPEKIRSGLLLVLLSFILMVGYPTIMYILSKIQTFN